MYLPDETPLVEVPPEAYPKADAMRALINADLEEVEIARQVMEFDLGDFDVQMGAWTLLTWKEQTAWRTFRQLARGSRG
jgi:hypothetical protein